MADNRPDARATALTYLTPALLGIHSLLLPWLAVDDDGADELYAFWDFLDRGVFDESSVGIWWLGVVGAGVVVSLVCLVRAGLPDAAPSWVASGLAALLALFALGTPFAMVSALADADSFDTGYSVRWGGPVTLALAAAWVSVACLTGGRDAVAERGRGWDRPGAVSWWRERGM